jgi:hypothetical protein
VSSLIYAQLGSDNGGVVVNLGLDGILCQAAHKFITGQNSEITLKLRGSGLNAEIAGNVVWLGATQKEVGISFKSLPANVKQSLADWIARESGPAESDTPKQAPAQKSISEIADMAVPEKKTIPRSLSAALALARAMSADHASPVPDSRNNSDRSGSADSSAVNLPVEPSFEIFPNAEDLRATVDPFSDDSEDSELDRTSGVAGHPNNLVEFPEKDHSSDDHDVLGLPPLSVLKQSLAEAMKEIATPPKELEKASDLALPAKVEIEKKSEVQNEVQKLTVPVAAPLAAPLPRNVGRVSAAQIAEEWIPPAILLAWNRLNVKQRQLFTHAGTVSLGLLIGLLLILLVTHLHGSSAHPVKNVPEQQATISPDSPADAPDISREFTKQGPPMLPTIQPGNQAKPSEPSMFSKFANSIFGTGSDGSPKINDYQMGLAVWTSQSSGYYYCSDDPYVKSVESGVPMLQGDALQAGYRPRLGQFCN